MTLPRGPLSVRMGGNEYPVDSYEDASAKFRELRNTVDVGGMPAVELIDQGGNPVGYIGQGGEVYEGNFQRDRLQPDRKTPVYQPPRGEPLPNPDIIEGEAQRVATKPAASAPAPRPDPTDAPLTAAPAAAVPGAPESAPLPSAATSTPAAPAAVESQPSEALTAPVAGVSVASREEGQGGVNAVQIESLRRQLRDVETKILLKAPPKLAANGGDIEAASKHKQVPAKLKEERAALKAQIRAAQAESAGEGGSGADVPRHIASMSRAQRDSFQVDKAEASRSTPGNWKIVAEAATPNDLNPERAASQLAKFDEAVKELDGQFAGKSRGASSEKLVSAWTQQGQLRTAIAQSRAANPEMWAAYDARQAQVAALKVGDRVNTAFGGSGVITRKFGKNWRILDDDGIHSLQSPAGLTPAVEAAKAKLKPASAPAPQTQAPEQPKPQAAAAKGVDESAVRTAYNAAMTAKTGQDYDWGKGDFGDMIVGALNRDPEVMERARNILTNGNNETGLKVFFKQAGVKFPKTQREQKAAFDAYIGVSKEDRAARDKAKADAKLAEKAQSIANRQARQPIPEFKDYEEARRWHDVRVKSFPSKGAYHATAEYGEYVDKVRPLHTVARDAFVSTRNDAMAQAGVKVGDRVQSSYMGAMLTNQTFTGTVVMRGGDPWVKLDAKMTVSKNRRISEVGSVRWSTNWTKLEAANPKPTPNEKAKAEVRAKKAKAEETSQRTSNGLPPGFARVQHGVMEEIVRQSDLDGNAPQLRTYTKDGKGKQGFVKRENIQRVEAVQTVAAATHADPGEAPEVVTPGIVRESLQKAAAKTPLDYKTARVNLLGDVDAAIKAAKTLKDIGIYLTEQGINALSEPAGGVEEFKAEKVRQQKVLDTVPYITFDVPGDGKFKVLASKETLTRFRDQVAKTEGFKPKGKAHPVPSKAIPAGNPISGAAAFWQDRDQDGYRNALELLRVAGIEVGFGTGSGNTPIPYVNAKDVSLPYGFEAFVGKTLIPMSSGKIKSGWQVIEKTTGLGIGPLAATPEAAVKEASARLKAQTEAVAKGKMADAPKVSQAQLRRKLVGDEALDADTPRTPGPEATAKPTPPAAPVEAAQADKKESKPAAQAASEPVLESVEDAEPFYSATLQAVTEGKGAPKKGNAEAWKGWLDGAVRRGDMKQSERDWLGLDAWLNKQEKPVTREQLADFIRANEVQIEEVTLGEDGAVEAEVEAWWTDEGGANEETPYGELSADEQREARERYADEVGGYEENGPSTKFASYQLPGGENYRELLLTLPAKADAPTFDPAKVEVRRNRSSFTQGSVTLFYDGAKIGGPFDDRGTPATNYQTPESEWMQTAERIFNDGIRDPMGRTVAESVRNKDAFRSSHYDQPNILAHVRFNERTDADGKRVLFIEEIQSDWHQAGRKKGYKGKSAAGEITPEEFGEFVLLGRLTDTTPEQDARYEYLRARNESADSNAVPDAPFKATDEWAMLAFKRMVRHAAENGFDRIAWTTGEQQAERYDLSKHIGALQYYKNPDDTYDIYAQAPGEENGNSIIKEKSITPDRLEDLIGKELTAKIVEGGGTPNTDKKDLGRAVSGGELEGLDLKVGGAGMQGFYDNILPKAVNKWAKRFGGKVGQLRLGGGAASYESLVEAAKRTGYTQAQLDAMPVAERKAIVDAQLPAVHSIDLTPQMRDAALQGMPLFQMEAGDVAPSDLTPAERAAYESSQVDRAGLSAKVSQEKGQADAEASGLAQMVKRLLGRVGVPIHYLRGDAGLYAIANEGYIAQLKDEQRRRGQTKKGLTTHGLYLRPQDTKTGKAAVVVYTHTPGDNVLKVFTASHEIAGHHGLRALLGKDLEAVLDLARQNPTVRKVADSMFRGRDMAGKIAQGKMTPRQAELLATEEALADLAAANATGNWTRIEEKHGVKAPLEMRNKFAAMLANVVRKLKALFKARSVGFSDAQVNQLLQNARQAAQQDATAASDAPALESADRQSFADQVRERLRKGDRRAPMLDMGRTPAVLRMVGLNDLPMKMPSSVLFKLATGKQGERAPLTARQIAQLPELLDDPVAILDSATQPGSMVAVTSIVDADGNPVIVAILPDSREGAASSVMVNVVASAYGKNSARRWLETQVSEGRLRYVQKNEGSGARVPVRVQFPEGASYRSLTGHSLLSSDDLRNFRAEQRDKALGPAIGQPQSALESTEGEQLVSNPYKFDKLRAMSPEQRAAALDTRRWLDRGLKVRATAKLYRGVTERSGSNAFTYGRGLYTTLDRKEAAEWGRVIEMDHAALPQNPIRFDSINRWNEWQQFIAYDLLGFRRLSEFEQKAGTPEQWIRELDPTIDGVQIGTGKDAFFVKFPEIETAQPLESTEDQTQSEAFKRWFGKSAVVDADGKPRMVFHGTDAEFDVFEPSATGVFGPGIYFSDSVDGSADVYGDNIVSAYLKMENPWVIDADPESPTAYAEDFDHPSIDAVLALPRGREMFDRIKRRDSEHFDSELQDSLVALGYDGVIATYPDGSKEFVVFSPEQVKSATGNSGAFDPSNPSILESVEDFTLSDNPTLDEVRIPGEVRLDPIYKAGFKDVLQRLGQKFADVKPHLLATVPLNHLVDFAPKGVPAIGQYVDIQYQMQAFRNKLYTKYDKVAQDLLKFSAEGKGVRGWFGMTVSEQGRNLFSLMHDSTIAGIDPTADGYPDEKVTQFEALKARYEALPEEGQRLYRETRDAYKAQSDLLDQTISNNFRRAMEITQTRAERAHKVKLQEIDESGKPDDEKIKLRKQAASAYKDQVAALEKSTMSRLMALREMLESQRVQQPYFPLKRYGKHWVTVLDKGGTMVGFSKFQTTAEQEAFSKEMQAKGYTTRLKFEDGDSQVREMIDPEFAARVEEILQGSNVPDNVKDEVWQAYLERMPDMSMRKSFIHRQNVPGYHFDALKAFGSAQFHGSYQIARLKYGMELQETIDLAKEQTKPLRQTKPKDAIDADKLIGEIEKRHAFVMNPKGGTAAQVVTTAAFLYSLGANPAHLFLNATQTVMLGVPVLGSRYGFKRTAAALGRAVADFTQGKGHLDKANLSADDRKAFTAFMDSGLIDKTQAHDLAGVGETGVEYSAVRQKVMNKIGWFFHQSERLNREVTAMAAYRLARADGKNHETAVAQAINHTYTIHFDYSAASRARFMQGDTAKALLVFRNYNVNMLYRLFRDINDSLRGESPQVKREARKQLGAMMGMYGLFAGTMGMPFYGLAMALAGLGDDDDDPVTAEQQFVNGTVEFLGPTAASVLLRGLPGTAFDIDLTERIGMPNLWFRSPQQEMEGRDSYYYWMEQLLGAGVGPIKGTIDGFNLIMEGQIQRGLERAMPAALRNPMQAIRQAQEGGVTSLDGDLIKETTGGDYIAKALGFQPLSVSEQYDKNSNLKNADRRLSNRREKLLNQYFLAMQMGDDTAEVLADVQAFNLKNPDYAITRDTFKRSARLRNRNKLMSENGIVMTRRMRRLQERVEADEED